MDLSTVNINSIDLHSVDLSYLNQTDVDALILAYFSYEAAHSEDTNLAPPVLRTVWILLAISTIVVTTRLAVKLRTTRRLYTDDGLMGTALILAWVHAAFLTVSFQNGLGRHIFYLNAEERYMASKYGFISLIWSYLCPMFGRLSFCVFLLYVADTDPKTKKWLIWTFLIIQILVNVGASILIAATCGTHLESLWRFSLYGYKNYCLDVAVQTKYAYFAGSFNTLTDLYLTIQPAMLIKHTKLATRNKIGVASLLCLSVLAMIAAIVRTIGANALSEIGDFTYNLTPYVTWVCVELNVVLTVTSLPLLRPLARQTRERTARLLSINRKIKEPWDDTVSLRSMNASGDSKTGAGVDIVALGSTSSHEGFTSQQDPFAITRTVEVQISHDTNDVPLIHAALIGLVQGEMMERLAGR